MAGKKYEVSALKGTTGGNRYEDRVSMNKNVFEPITIDAKNALTVIYMLQSPEDHVVIRAVASLEVFGRKAPENLKLLSSLGIFEYLFPLVRHNDSIIKRFSQKLIGMLCSLEEFRKIVLDVDNILNIFVDILAQETDEVIHEYVALILAELSSECHAASELLQVDCCVETLFLRIQSLDPDVEKNCLDVILHLLNDIHGIDIFTKSPAFDIKLFLNLTSSCYPVIQNLAIDVLNQFTAGSRETSVLFAFRDALGVETVLNILENEEWVDLHENASNLLINVTENPDICDYILRSGSLGKLINLLDNVKEESVELKFVGILARMTQTYKGRKAMHILEMDTRFSKYLRDKSEKVQEFSYFAIANLAEYLPSLNNILEENPVDNILDLLIDQTKICCLRNTAAYALSVLCREDRRASEAFLNNEKRNNLVSILSDIFDESVELCQNVIQIFTAMSLDPSLRFRLINEGFFVALLNCLNVESNSSSRDHTVQDDVLECLSFFLIDEEARSLFNIVGGGKKLLQCLQSRFASVRDWAAHIVIIMAQNEFFVKFFIRNRGLDWMLKEKSTMYTLPNWQSAIEAIFRENLSAKFAYVGRLDFQDLTKDGFFVFLNPCSNFILLEDFFLSKCNPLNPVYFVNFSNENLYPLENKIGNSVVENEDTQVNLFTPEESKFSQNQNLQKYMKGADRNSLEEYVWDGRVNSYETLALRKTISERIEKMEDFFVDTLDPFLKEYVVRLKKKIEREELLTLGDKEWWCMHPQLIAERARIIAEFVACEMSGPNLDSSCNAQYKITHLNELKYYLGTDIIPLGFVRMGDYLERALLFKVLADKLGFPCALVRGIQEKAWIEIAMPVINIEELMNGNSKETSNSLSSSNDMKYEGKSEDEVEGRTESGSMNESNMTNLCWEQEESFLFPKLRMECFKPFPKYFLKPNAIIDLVQEPGRILKINSVEAREYCGQNL